MEMTINEAIEIINHYLDYPKEEVRKALLVAINTMRKYQKIEGLAEYHMLRFLPKEGMSGFQKDILEVLEDKKN